MSRALIFQLDVINCFWKGGSTLTKENSSRTVDLDKLGLCEHCENVLNIEEMPPDKWQCPHCHGILTNKTFGYRKINGSWKKIQWVGKGGKLTQRRPDEPFHLNGWHIVVEPTGGLS
jgi:hypothetical protein